MLRFSTDEIVTYVQKKGKKPVRQQIEELAALKRYYGYPPYQYIKHCLYLESFDGDIFDFIPPEIVHRYRDKMNPEHARRFVIDKKAFSEVMAESNLPVVTNLFTVKRGGLIRDRNGDEIEFHEFETQLLESTTTKCFIKPFNGGGGNGIYRMLIRDGILDIDGMKIASKEALYERLFSRSPHQEFIVQPEIIQHEVLNQLNPSSVNTIRIDTWIQGNDIVSNAALLRMSNGCTYTDNWAKGGIIVNIDLGTGVLGKVGRTKSKYGGLCFRQHPFSQSHFGGTRLPFWPEVKELVRYAAQVLRPLGFLGWDVAISTEGPILIEANHDFDVFMCQEAARGLRKTPVGREILRSLTR
jgi:hypothetical protein